MGIKNSIKKVLGMRQKEKCIPADEAYFKTRYGFYVDMEKRVELIQSKINDLISSYFKSGRAESYYEGPFFCTMTIEGDMIGYKDKIFSPFIENGYTVVDLDERVEELSGQHIFIISWRNAHDFRQGREDTGDTEVD